MTLHRRRRRRRGTGRPRRRDACAERGLRRRCSTSRRRRGGQIYRGDHGEPARAARHPRCRLLARRRARARRSRARGARHVAGASVWARARAGDGAIALGVSTPARARRHASCARARVILATGALERPFPMPGLDASGRDDGGRRADPAQDAGLVPQRRAPCSRDAARCCGSSPGSTCARAARSTRCSTRRRAGGSRRRCAHAAAFLASRYFAKGCDLVRDVRRDVRVVEYVDVARALGDRSASSACASRATARAQIARVDRCCCTRAWCRDIDLAGAAGCALRWNDAARVLRARASTTWGGTHACPALCDRRRRRRHRGRGGGAMRAGASPRSRSPTRWAASTPRRAIAWRGADRRALARALRGRALPRRALSSGRRVPHARRRHDRLPLRGGHGAAGRSTRLARGLPGPEPDEGVLALRHGPVPGRLCGLTVTELIARSAQLPRRSRRLPVAPRFPVQAGDARRARVAADEPPWCRRAAVRTRARHALMRNAPAAAPPSAPAVGRATGYASEARARRRNRHAHDHPRTGRLPGALDLRCPEAAAELIGRERAFGARNYDPLPVVLARGEGSWVTDVDGRRYLDLMSAYSAVSLGHAHPRIVDALIEQAQRLGVTSRAYLQRSAAAAVRAARAADRPRPRAAGQRRRRSGRDGDQGRAQVGLQGQGHSRRSRRDHRLPRQFPRPHDHDHRACRPKPQYRDGFGPFPPGLSTVPYGDADGARASDHARTRRHFWSSRCRAKAASSCRRRAISRSARRSAASVACC